MTVTRIALIYLYGYLFFLLRRVILCLSSSFVYLWCFLLLERLLIIQIGRTYSFKSSHLRRLNGQCIHLSFLLLSIINFLLKHPLQTCLDILTIF